MSLPQEIRVADHELSFPEGTARTEMDAGPAKHRARFTAAAVPHSGSIVVTGLQLATLWSFWTSSLRMGAEAFEWVDPRTGSTAMLRFTARPTARPLAPRADGARWVVRLPLEVLPDEANPAAPDEFQSLGEEIVAWGPWYRGLDEAPAGEVDASFRGASAEGSSSGGGGPTLSGTFSGSAFNPSGSHAIVPL